MPYPEPYNRASDVKLEPPVSSSENDVLDEVQVRPRVDLGAQAATIPTRTTSDDVSIPPLSSNNGRCRLSVVLMAMMGPRTIKATLETWAKNGLLGYADERIVFWQEQSKTLSNGSAKRAITDAYNFTTFGSDKNLRFSAIPEAVLNAKCKHVLYLEEDFRLIEPREVLQVRLDVALDMLESKRVQLVRLRHAHKPGKPFYSKLLFERTGSVPKSKWLASVAWDPAPEKTHPEVIVKCNENPDYWCSSTEYADFSFNPFLVNRDWFEQVLKPIWVERGDTRQPEVQITKYWEKMTGVRVANGIGLFSHVRIDR